MNVSHESQKNHAGRNKIIGQAAGFAAVIAVGAALVPSHRREINTTKAANATVHDIRQGHTVTPWQQGEAVIQSKDGRKVTVTRPILSGDVGEVVVQAQALVKDNPEQAAVKAYEVGENASSICYLEHGKKVSAATALAAAESNPVFVNTPATDITHHIYPDGFVEAAGQPDAGELVAIGKPQPKA